MKTKTYQHKNIILYGMPGAGKSTHAQLLISQGHKIELISLGERLREMAKRKTLVGYKIRRSMRRGEVVDDSIVERVIRRILKNVDPRKILLFDGYPRSLNQTYFLDSQLAARGQRLPILISMKITKTEAVKRLKNRRVCSVCSEHYILSELKNRLKCNRCGGRIVTRDDDRPEAIRKRFEFMDLQLKVLKHYYQTADRYYEIDAMGSKARTNRQIVKILDSK